jgi:glutathione S-transferase
MKLIGSLTSPFVRKVRAALAEKKLEYEFVIDSPWTSETRVPTYNPLGKIPVLVLKDGLALYDSRVIVEYVDNLSPSNRLIPANGRERIHVLRWEALADGLCDAMVAIFLEEKRPASQRSPEWIARQQDKINAALKTASEELKDNPWCAGTKFSLADVAIGAALGYLDFRFQQLDWRSACPNLATLNDRLLTRPAFADTVPTP